LQEDKRERGNERRAHGDASSTGEESDRAMSESRTYLAHPSQLCEHGRLIAGSFLAGSFLAGSFLVGTPMTHLMVLCCPRRSNEMG
jgi:hypothetical protein